MTTIGFLGFGKASFRITDGLRDEGDGVHAFDAAWQTPPASQTRKFIVVGCLSSGR
ncbi:hypothetical protein [Falsirhodobacter sp. 20TX0035]|uniref:hypothetical protein n=1 Tax=Falsirhodobacter sp. 20TX0035 TaxID=3022019 RepID=UPI00232AE1BF|nr:hypothetical protein [Falsirhodobacter sp. 20TX0035]MDB6453761.1 hypothetical protein [Falsirhodobacter sp. 20TX0035]